MLIKIKKRLTIQRILALACLGILIILSLNHPLDANVIKTGSSEHVKTLQK